MAGVEPSVPNLLAAAVREEAAGTNDGCKIGYVTRAELGRGEQGVAFSMNRNATGRNISTTHVLKISELGTPAVRRTWEGEAKLSQVLGMAEIGPVIYDFWTCRGKGYILMQRMVGDLRHFRDAAGPISEKVTDADGDTIGNIDHLNRVPESILRDYVNKLETLIGANYIHFDNHPGNLGLILTEDGNTGGILFDFGFTRKVEGMSHADKYNALAFSIGQILEHMPKAELDSNYLFKILVSIDKGTYVFGSLEPNVTAADIAAFRTYYRIPAASLATDFTSEIREPAGAKRPLYVGAKLYNYYLNMTDATKYDWPSYNTIYKIRQGKPIPAAKATATERNAPYPAAGAAGAAAAGPARGTGTRKRGGRRGRRGLTRRRR
jgi:hypothetical protein